MNRGNVWRWHEGCSTAVWSLRSKHNATKRLKKCLLVNKRIERWRNMPPCKFRVEFMNCALCNSCVHDSIQCCCIVYWKWNGGLFVEFNESEEIDLGCQSSCYPRWCTSRVFGRLLDFVSKIGTRRRMANLNEVPLLLTCDPNEYGLEASIGLNRRRFILAPTMLIHFESWQTVPKLAKAGYYKIHGIIQGPKKNAPQERWEKVRERYKVPKKEIHMAKPQEAFGLIEEPSTIKCRIYSQQLSHLRYQVKPTRTIQVLTHYLHCIFSSIFWWLDSWQYKRDRIIVRTTLLLWLCCCICSQV